MVWAPLKTSIKHQCYSSKISQDMVEYRQQIREVNVNVADGFFDRI